MRVFIINSVCGYGSTGRITSEMYSFLKEKGNDVKVAYGFGKARGVSEDDLIKINNKFGYYCHNLFARLTDRAGFFSTIQTISLLKKIEQFSPDIIQLHNLHGFYINISVLFKYLSKKNIPVVMTLHDCWTMTGHCAHFSYVNCEKWKTGCFNCPIKGAYPKSVLIDNSKKNYIKKKMIFNSVSNLTIVTPSKWLLNIVRDSYLRKHNSVCINNGIDTSIFYPRKSNFREKYNLCDKKIILSVSSVWTAKKGLNDILELSEIIDDNYVIVIVGINPSLYKDMNNIICIPKTNNAEELAEIYSSADIFYNPTYEDTYPTVNLEALSCGTPVITYNVGGSPETVNENGLIVTKKYFFQNYKEIMETVKFSKPQNFSKEKMYNDYLDLYNEIILKNKMDGDGNC